LLVFTLKMFLAFIVAALVTALVSREVIARWLGDQAGMKGVTLATGIGAVTPGGPMISFPLVAALSRAGSSRASMIAYLTSWEVLGFQRIMIWELPLLGVEYAALRILASLPLPFAAAFLSMYLPPDRDSGGDAAVGSKPAAPAVAAGAQPASVERTP
ncbi:MAG: permease, partial [Beijerinckiaceae bacterium]